MKNKLNALINSRVPEKPPETEPVTRSNVYDSKPGNSIKSFMVSLSHWADTGNARMLVKEYSENLFDSEYPALPALLFDETKYKRDYDQIDERIGIFAKLQNSTSPYIVITEATPKRMSMTDRLWALFIGLLAVFAMAVATINMAVVLFNTFDVFYLDNPWAAWCLAGLAPVSSVAFKLFPHILDNDQHKIYYVRGLHFITACVVILWLALFSVDKSGQSGELTLLDNGPSAFYIFTQLLMEVLIASILIIRLTELTYISSPERRAPNPDYAEIETSLKSLRQEQQIVTEKLKSTLADIEAHKSARHVAVSNALAQFSVYQARHKSLFD